MSGADLRRPRHSVAALTLWFTPGSVCTPGRRTCGRPS